MVCVICGVLPFCLTLGDVRVLLAVRIFAHCWLSPEQVEEREERGKQNGGLYEEEEAPKLHRKAERTLRYTDTATHSKDKILNKLLFPIFAARHYDFGNENTALLNYYCPSGDCPFWQVVGKHY